MDNPKISGSVVEVSAADMDRFKEMENMLKGRASAPDSNGMSSPAPDIFKHFGSNGIDNGIEGVQKMSVTNLDAQRTNVPASLLNGEAASAPVPVAFEPKLFSTANEAPVNSAPSANFNQPVSHDFSKLTPESRQIAQQMHGQNASNVSRLPKNIVTFTVPLPSGGRFYPKGNSFHGISEVTLRKVTSSDDDIIRSTKLLKDGKAFSYLIKQVLMDSTLDPDDLFDGDLQALIIATRAKAYGKMYNPGIKYRCDFCDTPEFENSFDLAELKMVLPNPAYRHVDNIFQAKLPECGATVLIKLFTIKDDAEITNIIAAANRYTVQSGIDRTESVTVRQHIVAVDQDTDPSHLNDFCEWMPVYDKLFIKQFCDEMEPRLKFRQDIVCPTCSGRMEDRMIPLTDRLFNPKVF